MKEKIKIIKNKIDKINEVSGLYDFVANWILIDFLTLEIEHGNISLSISDLIKSNPRALIYQVVNAVDKLVDKGILIKPIQDADYFSLNYKYFKDNKIF